MRMKPKTVDFDIVATKAGCRYFDIRRMTQKMLHSSICLKSHLGMIFRESEFTVNASVEGDGGTITPEWSYNSYRR